MSEAADVTEQIFTVDEGDQVQLVTSYYEWASPWSVVEIDHVEWISAQDGDIAWRTREIIIESSRGSQRLIRTSDDADMVRLRELSTQVKGPIETFAPFEVQDEKAIYTCDADGCDFTSGSERGVNIHRGQKHDTGDELSDKAVEDLEAVAAEKADWVPVDDQQRVEWTDYSTENAGNGTECQNCGSRVQKDFTRVFEPQSEGGPRVCPYCTDLVREGDGTIRESRSTAGVGGDSA